MNTHVPLEHVMVLAAALFAIGLAGLLARRNLIFMLVSVEVMLNAAGLVFIAAGAYWGQVDGQSMFIFILTMAAAEVAVGLAIILQFHWRHHHLDADAAATMKG